MQLSNIPVIIACFFLLLFSFHLFIAKKGNKRQNRLLSLLFFARFGQILTSMIISESDGTILPIIFQIFTPLFFAAPACFYLYISGFLDDANDKKNTWLHFFPVILAMVHVIPWPGLAALDWKLISQQFSENGYISLRVSTGLFPAYFQYLARPILTLSYLAMSWIAVIKANKSLTKPENSAKDWMYFLLRVATFFQLTGFLPILFNRFEIPIYHNIFIIANCSVLLVILLYALHKPRLFYGYLLVETDWSEKNPVQVPSNMEASDTDLKYIEVSKKQPRRTIHTEKRISLLPEQITQYCSDLTQAMENEKLFLHADLQIIDLAGKLGI